jgi:hypothetical protein
MQHPLEPLAVATSFDADEHFTTEVRVKVTDIVKRVVKKSLFFNLTIGCIAPLDELLPGMKIYATIDGHGDSPFLHSSPNASLCLAARESHPFHHIRRKSVG